MDGHPCIVLQHVAALLGVSSHDDSHMTISETQKQLWPVQEFKPLAVVCLHVGTKPQNIGSQSPNWARETIEGVIERLEEQA